MSAGRILVVDDDPQIRRVMRVTLTGQGYEVDDAKSGDAALEKLRDERFDLVLLDMNMPGIGGLETCRAIRGQSEIAIIMLTVRDTEIRQGRRAGRRSRRLRDQAVQPVRASGPNSCSLRRTPSMQGPAGRVAIGFVDSDIRGAIIRGHRLRADQTANRMGDRLNCSLLCGSVLSIPVAWWATLPFDESSPVATWNTSR